MHESTAADAVRATVRERLTQVDLRSAAPVRQAAAIILDTVTGGGIVYAAGSGHSLLMVCEMFYRAGGLAAVRPLWDPRILPLNGARASSLAERREGLGLAVVDAADPGTNDALVVFSTSGRNPYPVEIAGECARRGLPVIAVTSAAASAGATARTGSTVADHATVLLDSAVPAGDVTHPPEQPRTAPVSTMLTAYLWAQLLAELDSLAAERGVELPRWTSANVPGGDEANAELFTRYAPRIPELDGQD